MHALPDSEIKNKIYELQLCRGFNGCVNANGDSCSERDLFTYLQQVLSSIEIKPLAGNVHTRPFAISISLCPNGCTRPQIADIGIIAVSFPQFEYLLCSGCGDCLNACREKALCPDHGDMPLKKDNCIGCGDCINVCPEGAVTAETEGFRVLLGGRLGRHPHLGEDSGRLFNSREVCDYIVKIYKFWLDNRRPGERLYELIRRKDLP